MSRVEAYGAIIVILFIVMSIVAFRSGGSMPVEYFAENCATCHGSRAELSAHGLSRPLRELSQEEIVVALESYKEGEENRHGAGASMRVQVEDLTGGEIRRLAEHIKSLK